jgi:hypothetical protein
VGNCAAEPGNEKPEEPQINASRKQRGVTELTAPGRRLQLFSADRQEIAAVERINRLDNSLIVHGSAFDYLAQKELAIKTHWK